MDKKTKLQNLLKVFTPDETKIDFTSFESEIKKLEESLKQKVQATTLSDVNTQLEKNRQKINFTPLTTAFDELKQNLTDSNTQLLATLNDKLIQLSETIKQSNEQANLGDESLKTEIETLIAEVAVLSARKIEIPDFGKQIKNTESKLVAMIDTAKTLDTLEDEKEKEATQEQFAAMEKELKKLRKDTEHRGGSMPRRWYTQNFNNNQSVTGVIDGSNATFYLADRASKIRPLSNDAVLINYGGGWLNEGEDYTLNGGTLTMLLIPQVGVIFQARFQ